MGIPDVVKQEKELGCCGKFAKLLLYTFNFMFLLGGILLIVMGMWVSYSKTSRNIGELVDTSLYKAAAYVLLVAGCCVLAVAGFGCCGAKFENRCLLLTYFVLLLIIFLFEFIAGIIALACYTQAEAFVEDTLTKSLNEDYGGSNTNATEGWDWAQKRFECCGVSGNASTAIAVYSDSMWHKSNMDKAVPKSCCRAEEDATAKIEKCQAGDISEIYSKGCYTSVRDEVIKYATVLAGVGIAVSVIQIFGMIFAFCMFRQLI